MARLLAFENGNRKAESLRGPVTPHSKSSVPVSYRHFVGG